MNLEFNIAVHLLTFLVKHPDERYSSGELAERICVNPVQLRRVTRRLNEQQYLVATRGKFGGYQSNQSTHDVNLADLFVLFNEEKSEGRIFTGNQGSDCEISREIGHTMSQFHQREQDLLEAYYKNITIKDVLKDILKEDSHETV
ncbi:Rrf2 family transcriptional regulator [Staphylococcus pseudoxylosus]|uniref:redox-sensitive transcriptional regulator HypR n=1 Tax=Staphylococcus pseudoxylosus TaxID=2282419 RepID=UPI000D1D3CFA|nr:redox-sensitive transcriptional regulator HypR [Staphylococcus pseudoxylosus]PTI45279.1 transcriptional regulator [Staphylococcus xylosus]MDW8797271.1 redox-sensitive transcriptional regulator HypR [Staphylococcus pseudoxylosus]MEB6036299.1 Rrf2 family transcriptional regulator [Staphylococcus pseudoxylosus]MEB6061059.1 Rrf2 family transcriptional regulator [Staphylococcus pseudoxylosus]MEB7754321.1 Rrf2 family transcriptional regulator [Staphylococcus pseudoxylosus]